MKKHLAFILLCILILRTHAQISVGIFTIGGLTFETKYRYGLETSIQGSPMSRPDAPGNPPYGLYTDECRVQTAGTATDFKKIHDVFRAVFNPARAQELTLGGSGQLSVQLYIKRDGTFFDIVFNILDENKITPQEIAMMYEMFKDMKVSVPEHCNPNLLWVYKDVGVSFEKMHTDPLFFGIGAPWDDD